MFLKAWFQIVGLIPSLIQACPGGNWWKFSLRLIFLSLPLPSSLSEISNNNKKETHPQVRIRKLVSRKIKGLFCNIWTQCLTLMANVSPSQCLYIMRKVHLRRTCPALWLGGYNYSRCCYKILTFRYYPVIHETVLSISWETFRATLEVNTIPKK